MMAWSIISKPRRIRERQWLWSAVPLDVVSAAIAWVALIPVGLMVVVMGPARDGVILMGPSSLYWIQIRYGRHRFVVTYVRRAVGYLSPGLMVHGSWDDRSSCLWNHWRTWRKMNPVHRLGNSWLYKCVLRTHGRPECGRRCEIVKHRSVRVVAVAYFPLVRHRVFLRRNGFRFRRIVQAVSVYTVFIIHFVFPMFFFQTWGKSEQRWCSSFAGLKVDGWERSCVLAKIGHLLKEILGEKLVRHKITYSAGAFVFCSPRRRSCQVVNEPAAMNGLSRMVTW